MIVRLTSFKRWHEQPLPAFHPYSIAVYQPHWYPKLDETRVFEIRRANGTWIRPRDFIPEGHDPTQPNFELLQEYNQALLDLYGKRNVSISQFLQDADTNLALCCWCPYDKAAQRQLHDYGGFVCHSAVVESYLVNRGIEVSRDLDRSKMVSFL